MHEEKKPSSSRHFFYSLGHGLGRPLFITFILLALIPLVVASWTSYQTARSSLLEKEVKNLQTALSLRSLYFGTYFQERLNDLVLQADLRENILLLQSLQQGYNKSGKPLAEFITSYDYIRIATEHSQDLQDFHERAGYSNIYLVDIGGDILFSIHNEEDFGTNLFKGPYHDSALAKLCRMALETGRPLSSDLTIYTPAGQEKTLFTAQLMVDESGEEIGFLVMQIQLESIDSLMADVSGLGKTGQVFLVGNDGLLRSSLRSSKVQQVLVTPVNNILVEKWLQREVIRHTPGHEEELKTLAPGNYEGSIYKGQSGNKVLGISEDMDSLSQYDMHWLMIAEVDEAEVLEAARQLQHIFFIIAGLTSVLILLLAAFLTRQMTQPLVSLTTWAQQLSTGDLSIRKMKLPDNEIGTLYQALSDMVSALKELIAHKDRQEWVKTGEAGLIKEISGEGSIAYIGESALSYLCRYLNLPVGAFFTFDSKPLFAYESDKLKLKAGYAYAEDDANPTEFDFGQGLVGQAAQDKKTIHLKNVTPELSNLNIESGLAVAAAPRSILVLPLLRHDILLGVLEFGSHQDFMNEEVAFLEKICEHIADAIHSSRSREQMQSLLKQTQQQAVQLTKQQLVLEERSKKTEQASLYKSEFLANMSHELRTPLNSILLLSNIVAENKNNTLSDDDTESIQTIHKAGMDLLKLINEILDLAKVESGRMEVEITDIETDTIARHMADLFSPICEDKGLAFEVLTEQGMPQTFRCDQLRLEQLLKNFLSNSCKFTKTGNVTLRMGRVKDLEPGLFNALPETLQSPKNLAFTVSDSGVGIAKEKQELIFESFHQADGSTARQYGGTGLGLSISREIAKLLGGQIVMTSRPDQGSSFTLVIPESKASVAPDTKAPLSEELAPFLQTETVVAQDEEYVVDDRHDLVDGDKVLLIVDDDPIFAKTVRDLARAEQFKVLVAESGETGLQFVERYNVSAIVLDIGLPGMDGWSVLNRLKEKNTTRHIPVQVVSAQDSDNEALRMGALNFITKPADSEGLIDALAQLREAASGRKKKVLLVEDDKDLSLALKKFITAEDIEFLHSPTAAEALALLQQAQPDCVILDLGLPDMSGEELLITLQENGALRKIPVVIYTGQELSASQKESLKKYARTIIIKGASSHELLLKEISLFLHRLEEDLPPGHQRILHQLSHSDEIFKEKKILLVDDDMRNVFSLRKLLSDKAMEVIIGKNGQEALDQLESNEDIDLVLMDIMMPVMDGYEAMAVIRKNEKFKKLPIIAITAKAMKGDRKKCIGAGANDYLAKPIDPERLLAMMRVWLQGAHDRQKR